MWNNINILWFVIKENRRETVSEPLFGNRQDVQHTGFLAKGGTPNWYNVKWCDAVSSNTKHFGHLLEITFESYCKWIPAEFYAKQCLKLKMYFSIFCL